MSKVSQRRGAGKMRTKGAYLLKVGGVYYFRVEIPNPLKNIFQAGI